MAIYSIENKGGITHYTDTVENVTLTISSSQCKGLAQLAPMPVLEDKNAFLEAVKSPVAGLPLEILTKEMNAKSACVIVSDATRNVPNYLVAEHVVDALVAGGVPMDKIFFFEALGVHRPATEAEMRAAIGENLWGRVSIENHTPFDYDNLVYLGDTSQGTPIEVNKKAYECDIHISIGKTEPHEFAGFSGGRKSVLPGIASERCIITNHRPEMISQPDCVPGSLDNNPVHKDMLETAKKFGIHYNINFVMTGDGEPSAIFGGSLEEAHAASVAYSRKYCDVNVGHPDVIVTTPGTPLNIDLYQSMKPLIALTDVLDENSVVAMYCECPEGINSEDMMKPFQVTDSVESMLEYVTANYKIQMDHALLLAKIIKKKAKVVIYSPNVAPADIESMYFYSATSVEDMFEKACALTGKENPSVLFYPQAQKTLPLK